MLLVGVNLPAVFFPGHHLRLAGPGLLYPGVFAENPQGRKMMINHFGEEYLNYQARTGRIFPSFSRRSNGGPAVFRP